MPQSLSKVLVRLIFSTRHRERLILEAIGPRLHALSGLENDLSADFPGRQDEAALRPPS
jgi:hypothetical protein